MVFPEAFVSSYPKGLDFGARVGGRTTKGRQYFQRYYDSAVDIPGPGIDRLAEISGDNDIYLVVGVIERERGTLYCTAAFLSPEGKYLGKHRKLMPTGMERIIWGFGDGSTLPVYDTPLGRLGAVICWENYMPLLRTAMYGKGIQLYCAPTADDRDNWHSSMIHVAIEGRCFVLSCCQYLTRGDCRMTIPLSKVTIRRQCLSGVAARSSARWGTFWPAPCTTRKGYSPRRSTSPRSRVASTILMSLDTTHGPMCSGWK